jgi:hypothetical protein
MSSRPDFKPHLVITNGDMSGNIISEVTIIQKLSMISYDVSWAGTAPVGSMSVQVSNTFTQNGDGTVRNPGNWTTLVLSAPAPVSGNSGNGMIDIDATGAYAIRLVYTRGSGTGLMNATISAKAS